jgi:hypothetical protein
MDEATKAYYGFSTGVKEKKPKAKKITGYCKGNTKIYFTNNGLF